MLNLLTPCASTKFAGLLAAVLVLMPAPANAATTHEGTAYRLDDGKAAYREKHLLFDSAGRPARLVLYSCMNGAVFARKVVVERASAVAPDFDFTDGRTGYREGVRTTGSGREAYWQKSSSDTEKRKVMDVPADTMIDAGFDAMVRANWTQLGTKAGLDASFLLPSVLRSLKVNIQRLATAPTSGMTHLRMKLDTWYGFAAPDTHLDYRTSDRRLLRFRGIGSIRDQRGRNQAVRIEFPGGLQGQRVSAGEIQSARGLPLAGQCGA